MIANWKEPAIEGMAASFAGWSEAEASPGRSPADVEKLHALMSQLVVERDFWVRACGR